MAERCSMCGDSDATVMDRWPAPVCGECDSWLDSIGADLEQMEVADTALKKLADQVDEAWSRVADHLTPTMSDRGFKRLPPIEGNYGGDIQIYESSSAEEPKIWLAVNEPNDLTAWGVHVASSGRQPYTAGFHEATLHLTASGAWKLKEQLEWLIEHHYHGDARP